LKYPEISDRILVGSNDMAEMMDDKYKSYLFASNHNLPFVPTAPCEDELQILNIVRNYGFPIIAKPRHGNGSRGIKILLDQHHLDNFFGKTGFIFSPFINSDIDSFPEFTDGIPYFFSFKEEALYGVQGYISKNGSPEIVIGYLARMVNGKVERIQVVNDFNLLKISRAYLLRLSESGWKGPVNIQFKKDSLDNFYAIEFNGRFTGASSARTLLGSDEVANCLNDWLGDSIVTPMPLGNDNYIVLKILSDNAVQISSIFELESSWVWEKS
jgi:carbamoyl-phosphate synthase large subunit